MTTSPQHTVFYTIEKTIKEYRRFALRRIQEEFKDITLDQALLMQFLQANPALSQSEIAKLIFKDNASVTRMIELMVKNKYLTRSPDKNDRRKHKIQLTKMAKTRLDMLNKIVVENRKTALQGIDSKDIETLEITLNRLIENCK